MEVPFVKTKKLLQYILGFMAPRYSQINPQIPGHFARKTSARVSQTLLSSYLSHVTAAVT